MSGSVSPMPSVGQQSMAVGNTGVANGMDPAAFEQLKTFFKDPATAQSDSVSGVLSYLNAQRQTEQVAQAQAAEQKLEYDRAMQMQANGGSDGGDGSSSGDGGAGGSGDCRALRAQQ